MSFTFCPSFLLIVYCSFRSTQAMQVGPGFDEDAALFLCMMFRTVSFISSIFHVRF